MQTVVEKKSGTKGKYRADIILIAVLLIMGIVSVIMLFVFGEEGTVVQVRVSGQTVKSFSLSEETRYEITGANGGKNILVIKDHSAWIEDADCPDKLCRNMGKISRAGQSVVCLPHEVVVEITGGDTGDNDVDIVAE